ncbi:hypothetical protein CU669_07450 [Paramagnetospirillum kuznetsovii]|uniref:DUF177 domain-containing protein n=1 Tax=Paramagnetospirillum kuznetsovii TaxID=2053833 RepID=A0A364NZK6_9PROT|nr:DUF177 domain-containing protein [Paramagnetospirillum kuznetsovii]RAU22518.1 hypothetical protein CU669_07450 [Paramagnetospirillum kuznetsovii]
MIKVETPPEFSRPLLVDALPAKISRQSIEADSDERAAIATRLDLVEIKSLSAKISLEPLGRTGLIRVNGRLTAEVVQTCCVTLAPIAAVIEDEFQLTFGPPEAELDEAEEIEVSWDGEDPPDPITDGAIDIGELVVEHLALALDPFPRAPDAAFEPPPEPEDTSEAKPNPFAVLAALRQKKE